MWFLRPVQPIHLIRRALGASVRPAAWVPAALRAGARAAAHAGLLAALVGASTPVVARAQEKPPKAGCAKCDEGDQEGKRAARARAERDREAWREYRSSLARLRRQVDALRRELDDARAAQSLRAADSTLRRLDPDLAGAAADLALLHQRLSSDAARLDDNPQLERLAENVAELQVRLSEGMARQAMRDALAAAREAAHEQAAHEAMIHDEMVRAGAAHRGSSQDLSPPAQRPRGWLGVSFSGSLREEVRDGSLFVRHYDYPRIESVEPGSPAAQAGLARGDTVIAYNGRDLRRGVAMAKLLEPGNRLVVRVRRRGVEKNIPVRVRTAPAPFAWRWPADATPDVRAFVPADPDVDVQFDMDEEGNVLSPPKVRVRTPRPHAPLPPAAVRPPTPPVPPTPPPPVMSLFVGGASAVAGAEVVRMNDDLREAFGGREGLLVLNVTSGSPAAQAGLRGGDVITRAGGSGVSTPTALQRVLRKHASDRVLTLEVVRKGATRKVKLRW